MILSNVRVIGGWGAKGRIFKGVELAGAAQEWCVNNKATLYSFSKNSS